MAASIAVFVSLEVLFVYLFRRLGFFASIGHGAFVASLLIEMVVYLAVEVGGTVKPLACSDELTASKPLSGP